MLESIDYASLLQYTSQKETEIEKKSHDVMGDIKAGRLDEKYRYRIVQLIEENPIITERFLHANVTLVPVPRSSLFVQSHVWPAWEICKLLSAEGYGLIMPCVKRTKVIRKAAFCKKNDRPSVQEHMETLDVDSDFPTANITMIDDFVTAGRMFMACALKLKEKFPNSTIRSFALMRTISPGTIDKIANVTTGVIQYNAESGWCSRKP